MQNIETEQDNHNKWFLEMSSKYLSAYNLSFEEKESKYGKVIIATIINNEIPSKAIEISTYNREITFYFSNYHAHFDSLSSDNHENTFVEFKVFLEKFMHDKISIIECYEGDQITLGSYVENIDELEDYDASRIEIRCWSGKLDSTISKKMDVTKISN